MPETINLEMTEEEAVQLKDLMSDYLDKIKTIRSEMEKDQLEIDRYAAATQAIIDRMKQKAA
ncbi:MAG: hypothetical protein SF097_12970 [Acidobacteriota bacterium]|nr:hypothetical protein [Acidobacteriota bacterium]